MRWLQKRSATHSRSNCLSLVCATAVAIAGMAIAVRAATSENASPQTRTQIGDKLGPLTFTDTRFLPRSLSDFVSKKDPVPKRAFVLVFTNVTCPLVQRFLPRLKQLDEEFRGQGVQFVAMNVGPDDSLLDIATQGVEHDMPFPFAKDADGSCVAACGVERTATAVLIDANYKLRYRGRIDNSYRLSGTAPGATSSELRDAIRSLLAGDEVAVPETAVDGCLITKPAAAKASANISYAQQIAPIVAKNCVSCHQPGTAAPFSLTSYEDIAANSAMIAEVVEQRRMPPWFASSNFGVYSNNRTMPAEERKLLVNWALAGYTMRTPRCTSQKRAKHKPRMHLQILPATCGQERSGY